MKQEHLKRIRRLMTIILEVKTSPHQTVPQLLGKLSISKSQFYKDRNVLLGDEINERKSEQPLIKFIDVPARWTEFLIRRERG